MNLETIDPRRLPASRLRLLRQIRDARVVRVKHGWRAAGGALIRARTAAELAALHLVRRTTRNGVVRLEPTPLGNTVLEIAEERSRK